MGGAIIAAIAPPGSYLNWNFAVCTEPSPSRSSSTRQPVHDASVFQLNWNNPSAKVIDVLPGASLSSATPPSPLPSHATSRELIDTKVARSESTAPFASASAYLTG